MASWYSVLVSQTMKAFHSSQPQCFQWHFYQGQDNSRAVGNSDQALAFWQASIPDRKRMSH